MASTSAATDTLVPQKPNYQELGISGTRLFAGILSEETVPALSGFNAYKTYNGMRFDATGSALYKAVELPVRSARWFINPPDDDPKNVERADFIHHCLWDFGSQSFDDVLRQALGMLVWGFSWMEICYAIIQEGPFAGKVGWDKFAWRSQATKWRWNMDYISDRRQLVSVTQLAPPYYEQVEIPRNKLALFVNDQEGDNYDGWSLFRPAWRDYFIRDALYRVRAIGLERAYMGIPVADLPEGFGDDLRDLARQIVETIRTDEQAGVIKPDTLGLDILHNSLQEKAMDTAIQYHNRQMLLSGLAQFLDLGSSGAAGAYSLSSDHSELFLYAVNAKANYLASVVNMEPCIPSLIVFNYAGATRDQMPRLEHGDIGQRALDKLGRTLQALGQWGFLTPDDETEDALRQMLDLPERDDNITDENLFDLAQEVFPIDSEFGRLHQGTRLPSPLESAAMTAKAAQERSAGPPSPAGAQGTAKGTAPPRGGSRGGRQTAASDDDANAADMAERRDRYLANVYRLSEVHSRRRWERVRGRPTDSQRLAAKATERFAEALDEVHRQAEYQRGTPPELPSQRVARLRRPHEVPRSLFADATGRPTKAVPIEPGQARKVVTRQMALAKSGATGLQHLLAPRRKE